MKTYDQSIYGATYTPLQGQPWGQATRKGDKVYLHVFDWPADGKLVIELLPGSGPGQSACSAEKSLAFTQNGPRLEITLPPQSPDPDVSVLAVEIDPSEKGWSEYSAPVSTTKDAEEIHPETGRLKFHHQRGPQRCDRLLRLQLLRTFLLLRGGERYPDHGLHHHLPDLLDHGWVGPQRSTSKAT